MQKIEVGNIIYSNKGHSAIVVEKVNSYKVKIKFLDEHGHEIYKQAGSLARGSFKNPYSRDTFGVGYIGVGRFGAPRTGYHKRLHGMWKGILQRCYVYGRHSNYRYSGCSVHPDWHNYQNFAEWFDLRYGENYDVDWQIDKDILLKGNKVYSEATCRLVPRSVNMLLVNSRSARGDYLIGVRYTGKLYTATVSRFGVQCVVGRFKSELAAFECYKEHKEAYVKEVANMYKGVIEDDVYDALISWRVSIDD